MQAILGEIRMFAGPFAPEGWAICDGAELQVSDHPELFALFGTTYGGDGVRTFGLPDMHGNQPNKGDAAAATGRIPVHMGTGAGLSAHPLGQSGGADRVQLSVANMPPHTHAFRATTAPATEESPKGNVLATAPAGQLYYSPLTGAAGVTVTQVAMNGGAVTPSGSGDPFSIGMPTLGVVFIICLRGEYPDLPTD